MRVLVLGAGIIGVASAYYLAKAGYEVTVLEANEGPARECSFANGGQLSFSHIENWSSSLSFFSLIRTLTSTQPHIALHNFGDKKLMFWLASLLSNSFGINAHKNSRNLYRISALSRELFRSIIDEEKIDFDFNDSGILHFYRTKKELNKAINNAKNLDLLEKEAVILDADQCIEKEPSLVKLYQENKLAGGLFYKNDACGNCAKFVQNLAKICQEKYKVKFDYNVKVKNILTNYKKITGVNTTSGVYDADNYVYALGFGGISLLSGIKIDPKIRPLQGYSISSKVLNLAEAPQIGLTDTRNKIVYSRIGNIFRVAGVIEINNSKNKISKNKIEFLQKSLNGNFSNYGDVDNDTSWSGIRPFRPNSLPLIYQVKKYGNLYLNTGHGSLGWTLSLASGQILADLIDNKLPEKFGFLRQEKVG